MSRFPFFRCLGQCKHQFGWSLATADDRNLSSIILRLPILTCCEWSIVVLSLVVFLLEHLQLIYSMMINVIIIYEVMICIYNFWDICVMYVLSIGMKYEKSFFFKYFSYNMLFYNWKKIYIRQLMYHFILIIDY